MPWLSLLPSYSRLISRLGSWLPVGDSLGAQDWIRRHRVISGLVWGHALVVPLYGISRGQDPVHAIAECSVIALLGVGAGHLRWSRMVRSVMATLGLVTASAILTHFSGGLIEMHFHFFVVVAIVSLYQSWVGGQLTPGAVYNHPSAVSDAWRWALVHGGFILAESAACLVAWRLNEVALSNERAARTAMGKAYDDLAAAQSMSSIGSWDWDTITGTVWWSDELYRIVGREPETFEPAIDSFLAHIVAEDRPVVTDLLHTTRTTGIPLDFECRLRCEDGTERIVHIRSGQDVEPTVAGRVLGTCQDITPRKALEAELQHQAFHDHLTGLPNRALFLDRLEHGLALSRRTNTPLALIYLDLDDFKAVNDTLGHETGDQLLLTLGGRLVAAVRDADTVARLGGDEFAILLEDTDELAAAQVAETLLHILRDPIELPGSVLFTKASMGIAVAGSSDDPGDVLRHADIAMYAAKRQGKNGYRHFTDDMQASLTARLELETQLQTAITDGQLVLHYQPLVDLRTDAIQGVEALVRWDHPDRGLLFPSEFIPLAEDSGLISQLGEWVLARATTDLRRLHQTTGRPLYVSVNVAAPQLRDGFAATVRRALADADLAPEHLLLEITETCLVRDEAIIVPELTTLRAMGIRIATDDFGTGYSSLAYLRQLPIDQLKIDRSFIRNIQDGPEGSALAHAIINLGATFGLHVVGEGIETPEQAAILRQLGCGTGQGYHYQRPADLASLIATIDQPLAHTNL